LSLSSFTFLNKVFCLFHNSHFLTILITKSTKIVKCAKICHLACFGSLDVKELCASTPINILEIEIFERPVVIEGEGFDLFSKNPDPLDDVEKIFKK